MSEKETCESCKFWETNDNPDHYLGSCKVSAPAAGVKQQSRWATTQKDEWCGEHQKRKK